MDERALAASPWRDRLLPAAAVVGTIVAVVNYFMPDNGIAGTAGAMLVIGSCALLAIVGYVLARRVGGGRGLMLAIALFLLAGTGFAAWLLEAPTLVGAMVVAAIGWWLAKSRPRATSL